MDGMSSMLTAINCSGQLQSRTRVPADDVIRSVNSPTGTGTFDDQRWATIPERSQPTVQP